MYKELGSSLPTPGLAEGEMAMERVGGRRRGVAVGASQLKLTVGEK